ncbi:hypothetical protein Bca52824_048166 [Brassica carinata]|uniref:Uncharacterized protein n=1 Tax=Brassica carinata TaxID=52824 RepID=A0A8X7RIF6_BRACI|nr:hypothetical protein Bca52824_048166 [Brassica carinata]
MRNEAEVDSAAFSDIAFNQAAMNRRYMLIEPSYKINSDDNAKSSLPNSVQKSEEKDPEGEPSESNTEAKDYGSVLPAEQKSEEKKKESASGELNKAEKEDVSDGEAATEQTLKPKSRQGTEKSNGDQKARDGGGGSGASSSLEENIVLGVALMAQNVHSRLTKNSRHLAC